MRQWGHADRYFGWRRRRRPNRPIQAAKAIAALVALLCFGLGVRDLVGSFYRFLP